jgi:hypothetical protein
LEIGSHSVADFLGGRLPEFLIGTWIEKVLPQEPLTRHD